VVGGGLYIETAWVTKLYPLVLSFWGLYGYIRPHILLAGCHRNRWYVPCGRSTFLANTTCQQATFCAESMLFWLILYIYEHKSFHRNTSVCTSIGTLRTHVVLVKQAGKT